MTITNSIGNALDDLVSIISPELAMKRRSWRNAYSGYEAASPTRKDLPFMADARADQIDSTSRDTIRARARNIERNSDIVAGMLYALENNVVGSKINMQAASQNDAFNERIEALFNEWMHSENCDITGNQSLTEIIKTVLRRYLIDGGIMINYCYSRKYKFGIQLQLREVDDLVTEVDPLLPNGNMLVHGIEMTPYGKPIAYLLKKYSPNGVTEYEPERIPANRIDFLWSKQRPSQFREMSNFSKSAVRINDLNDYNESIAFAQKVAACTSAFIETENYNAAPGRPTNDSKGNRLSDIQGGSIRYLRPGEKVKPFIPNGQAAEAENYIVTQLRMIAAGQGLSLESATRNVERVNYSSARQNMLADQQTYENLLEFLVEHFLRKMYIRFIESCYLAGLLDGTGFVFGEADYYKAKWLTKGLPWIDPLKEANANSIQLGNGGMSFQQFCAEHGADWRERLQEMKEVQDYANELGVTLSFIAANNAIMQQDNAEDGDDDAGENQKGSDKGGKS